MECTRNDVSELAENQQLFSSSACSEAKPMLKEGTQAELEPSKAIAVQAWRAVGECALISIMWIPNVLFPASNDKLGGAWEQARLLQTGV